MSPIYFAIGDIHGEADKLRAMHSGILDRIALEKSPAVIVHLGDYVDRGPDSHSVIEQILALESRFEGPDKIRVVSLKGNHEQMMLDAFDADEGGSWFANGGGATADSYAGGSGRADRNWRDTIPKEHIAFLRRLPTMWRAEDFVFVHAGIDPATFPDDDEKVRIWTRSNNFTDTSRWPERDALQGITVIHGHTPQDKPEVEPEISPRRINVDTGACYGGPLTAVVLKSGEEPSFLIVG